MNDRRVLENKTSRNISLDIARVIAILFVVMIHCSAIFITDYDNNTLGFVLGNIFNGLSRPGVALFLMISGALLLNEQKEKSLGDMVDAAKRILIIIVLWSVIYSVVFNAIFPVLQGEAISLSALMKAVINGHFHMWYLYMLIGLYLATPFLRKLVKKRTKVWCCCIFSSPCVLLLLNRS